MKLTLTSGQYLELYFSHYPEEKETDAKLILDDNEYYSIARCHENDQFTKEHGRKVSMKKIFDQTNFSKEERTEIWSKVLPKRRILDDKSA